MPLSISMRVPSSPIVHVSCAPSEIPYVGFSPVRLQTEIQPRPSRSDTEVKRKARMRSTPHRLYAAKVRALRPCSPKAFSRVLLARTTRSRGPWLPGRLCCPPSSSLTMASSETLACFLWLIFFVHRIFALRPRMGCRRELPQFKLTCLFRRAISRTPAGWSVALGHFFTNHYGLTLLCTGSALNVSTRSGSSVVCVTRLQSSLHATARWIACPTPARTFTFELSPPEVASTRRRI